MRKIISIIAVALFSVSAFAYDKGEMYIAPVLGYHFFDSDHELDDNGDYGLRFGKFITDSYALELEAAVAPTEEDNGDDQNATTISFNAVKHFDITKDLSVYYFLGLGGMFYDENHAGILGGLGARFALNDSLSLDARVKDMLMTESRNDVVPSIALNYAFGKAAKLAPAPVVAEKKVEEVAVAAPVSVAVDTDGDGVLDGADKCPTTPKGVAVDKDGCCLDSDGDGVKDFMDKCPTTPKGAAVDKDGCCLDSDGDGVKDYMDKCPNTKKGVNVDADGCFKSVTLHINFNTNSSNVLDQYDAEIKEFSQFLNENAGLKVEIQGHTDSRGSAVYNKKLSQKRADAVMKEISGKYGVDASRLTSVGYGEEMPVAPNDTPENMLKNRRIEAVVR